MNAKMKPCTCGKEPEVTFTPLPYLHGCYHIDCRNPECSKKLGTWYYYSLPDAIAEWNELVAHELVTEVDE